MHNVGKARSSRYSVFGDKTHRFCRGEIPVVKALDVCRFSLQVPPIEEYFMGLVAGDGLQYFHEGPLCLFQREFPACIYLEKS